MRRPNRLRQRLQSIADARRRKRRRDFHAEFLAGVVRRAREANAKPYEFIKAPRELGYGYALKDTVEFLAKVRQVALGGKRRAFIDMASVHAISSVAAVMLTAEAQRCNTLRPGSINGCDPIARRPRAVLRMMKFHEALGYRDAQPSQIPEMLGIHWGSAHDEGASRHLARIADLAKPVLQNDAFVNRALGAMNEALINVQMHAYREDLVDPESCIVGRWWASAMASPEDHEVWLTYMDHGVGITETAPRDLWEHIPFLPASRDNTILRAVIDEKRTSTNAAHHGKGLAAMVNLIDRAGHGSIAIISQAGCYYFESGQNPAELDAPLPCSFPGTLIVWRLIAPCAEAQPGQGNW